MIVRTKLRLRDEALDELADAWNRLLAQSSTRTVFVSPLWQRLWLKSFQNDREFRLYSVRDGDHVLGVAAFLAEDRRLAFSGDPQNCDYMDFVIHQGMEEPVLRALFEELAASPCQEIRLWGVPATSPTLTLLPSVAAAAGFTLTWEKEAVCPRVLLPPTWDAYMAQLTKKDRHELRRKMRRLFDSGYRITYYALTAPEEIGPAMDDFLRLMEQSKQEKAEFLTPPMGLFFRTMAVALAGEGMVRLYFLELDGKRVAAVLCFDYGNELLMYNSGFDHTFGHLAVGLISKALVVKDAIEQGRRAVDFLRGTERYKYDLGAHDVQVYRCTVTRQ